MQETVVGFWEHDLCWRNPDAPYQHFRYPYILGAEESAWEELAPRVRALAPDRLLLVVDGSLPTTLLRRVLITLEQVAPCVFLPLVENEKTKLLTAIDRLGTAALNLGATHASVIVAVGGGLVGNVAGLLAGVLLRGVRLVHVPTTLLAMSDSCLSLKQGVNSSLGKNHFGLFVPPALVWTHLSFLDTLPPQERRSALCELIKNVLAICPDRFDEVAAMLRPDAQYTQAQLARFIALCLSAKSAVMAHDALEKHEAVVLEYGHSIGHALEHASSGRIPHGIAVGMGMMVEATIAHELGWLSASDRAAHETLLCANGAPTRVPARYHPDELPISLTHDNKRGYLPPVPEHADLVLLEGLGRPHRTEQTVLTQVDERVIKAAIVACQA